MIKANIGVVSFKKYPLAKTDEQGDSSTNDLDHLISYMTICFSLQVIHL